MIVENQMIDVKITRRNIDFYKECGYCDISLGDVISVNGTQLTSGSKKIVDVKCDYCCGIVKVQYKDYHKYKFDKYSCQKCRQKKTSEYNFYNRQNSLYSRALKFCNKKGYKLISRKEDILNSDSRVIYEYPKHGLHEAKIYTLIGGHECIDCSVENQHMLTRKSADQVYNVFLQYGGILLNKDDYVGWNYKNLLVVCKECGETFVTSYCAFTSRNCQLCPKCASNISKGEHKIKSYLENNGIDFYMQFRFSDCKRKIPLPFDFYLPHFNICIEYDGEGHYIPIKRGKMTDGEALDLLNDIKLRDDIKTNYCNDNNIKLIRIPYWDFDNIDDILKKLFT